MQSRIKISHQKHRPLSARFVAAILMMIYTTTIPLLYPQPVKAVGLVVYADTTINTSVTYDSVIVLSGKTLTANAAITVTGDMRIASGGIVTHSTRNLSGLQLTVSDTLWVIGSVDVSARGLRGGGLAGCGTACGESYDTLGNIVCGPCGSTGGSYGGVGGLGGTYSGQAPSYGFADSIYQLGGGGGSEYSPYNPGGGGGGLIRISAGTIILDGEIRSDGQTIYPNCAYAYGVVGGGAGGGILIKANAFSGSSSAVISAVGGNGGCGDGGGGGGGRIAVFADNQSGYLGQILANGGYQNNAQNKASAGTIFRRFSKTNPTAYSELLVNNAGRQSNYAGRLRLVSSSIGWLRVRQGGTIDQKSGSIVADSGLTVGDSYSKYTLGSNASLSIAKTVGDDIALATGGSFKLLNGGTLSVDQMSVEGGSFLTEVPVTVGSAGGFVLKGTGSVLLRDSAVLRVATCGSGNLVSGSVDIDSTSRFVVDDGRIVVNSGLSIIKDGRFGMPSTGDSDIVNDVIVSAGGKITHSSRLVRGLTLNVNDTLWIQRNASPGYIDVSRMGLLGGGRAGCGTACGQTYDSLGNIICGPCSSTGGSYGGIGGLGGTYSGQAPAYGFADSVYQLGGGGGSEYSPYNPGGNGGGLVRIAAGTIVVDGEIRSDGESIYPNCAYAYGDVGGGAGGGISIKADVLSGGTFGTISAIGGNGGCGNSGGGGGGRIAVFADNLSGYRGQMTAIGGYQSTGQNWASAGTIFIRNSKANSSVLGTLILDNGGRMSSYPTPLKSAVSSFRRLMVNNSGSAHAAKGHLQSDTLVLLGNSTLTLDSAYTQTVGLLRVSSGVLTCTDTIRILQGAKLSGSGTINGSVVNSGVIEPGESVGRLTINGNFIENPAGQLQMELGGTTAGIQYDQLKVNGQATLAGTLRASFINLFQPIVGDSFQTVSCNSRIGTFSSLQGIDTALIGIWYRDSGAVLIVDSSNVVSTDSHIILSPAGNIPFIVNLRDQAGSPVVGSNDVWLDFESSHGIIGCPIEIMWPQVPPRGVSGTDGNIRFWPHAGGCTSDSVTIRTSHGVIGRVPIKSMDRNGGLYVTALDFIGDKCNDYNNDGLTDSKDWNLFSNFLGQTCLDEPANYTKLTITTIPEPGKIFQGDTIQVCSKILNTLDEPMIIDSVVFLNAGFGIARPWIEIGRKLSISLSPMDSVTTCQSFVVPISGHGCFQAHIYPRLSVSAGPAFAPIPKSAADSVVYGVRKKNDGYWAYIGISNGQELIAVQYDSITGHEDFGTARLLGFTQSQLSMMAGDDPTPFIGILHDPLGVQAANLWDVGFPNFPVTPVQDTLLTKLSLSLEFFRHKSESGSGTLIELAPSGQCNPCNPPNGCGGDGSRIKPGNWDFRDCCDTHDNCYCTGGSEFDRLICDIKLALCICAKDGIAICSLHSGLAYFFFQGVRWGGSPYFCDKPNPPDPPPPGKSVQLNIDTRGIWDRGTGLVSGRNDRPLMQSESHELPLLGDTVFNFEIPIGNSSGDSLILNVNSFLPFGWSYYLNHLGLILTPDTISGYIIHDKLVKCQDTGRIIISAYTMSEQYAGNAEIQVYRLGKMGDLDNDGTVDIADLTAMVDFLYISFTPPAVIDAAELTEDGNVDISDIVRLVDYLYISFTPLVCSPPSTKRRATSNPVVAASAVSDSSVTLITVDASESLRGLELTLVGSGKAKPTKLFGDNLDMVTGQVDSVLRIGVFDENGPNLIPAGQTNLVQIPGNYRLVSATAADLSFKSIVATVNSLIGPLVPREYSLSQNYPNPFNPVTHISYSLPKAVDAELTIINILGQKVRTLVSGRQEAGRYNVEWNSSNDAGQPVASGVYFYRLKAGDFTESKKMVLLK